MNGHHLPRGRILGRIAGALLSAAVLTTLATAVAAPPAGAAIGPFTVSPTSGPSGTRVTVSGSGCSPGLFASSSDYVSLTSTLPVSSRAAVSSGGAWSTSFTVPQGTLVLPALIIAACVTDGLPSLTTIYLPGTFTVTGATPPTSVVPLPPPTVPVTTPITRGTSSTTRATSSTTKAGSSSSGSSTGSGSGAAASGNAGRGSGAATRAGGSARVVASAGSVAADRRAGAEAGLRSPALTSEADPSAGHVSGWWWLVVALLIAAAVGATLWARHRLHPAVTEPSGDDPPAAAPGVDDDPLGDDWIEHSLVDDTSSISR